MQYRFHANFTSFSLLFITEMRKYPSTVRYQRTVANLYFSAMLALSMGLVDGLKKAVSTAAEQITSSSPQSQGIYFTNNFEQKAKSWGLSEKDALDVFYHGEETKPGMKVRKYNGYELCVYYGRNTITGSPYISTIWKRERR
jgi:hypothetical protein